MHIYMLRILLQIQCNITFVQFSYKTLLCSVSLLLRITLSSLTPRCLLGRSVDLENLLLFVVVIGHHLDGR